MNYRKYPGLSISSTYAEMTGDSCLARAVVPRTAAAVDHADTELIGHLLIWRYRAFCSAMNVFYQTLERYRNSGIKGRGGFIL